MRNGLPLTLLMVLSTAACTQTSPAAPSAVSQTKGPTTEAPGIEKIDHLIFLVMENRSFDHYFGTYPGVDGIPRNVCVPHPALGNKCTVPYHDTDQVDIGGPHTFAASQTDVNHGKMDGFIRAALEQGDNPCVANSRGPGCGDRVGEPRPPLVLDPGQQGSLRG